MRVLCECLLPWVCVRCFVSVIRCVGANFGLKFWSQNFWSSFQLPRGFYFQSRSRTLLTKRKTLFPSFIGVIYLCSPHLLSMSPVCSTSPLFSMSLRHQLKAVLLAGSCPGLSGATCCCWRSDQSLLAATSLEFIWSIRFSNLIGAFGDI